MYAAAIIKPYNFVTDARLHTFDLIIGTGTAFRLAAVNEETKRAYSFAGNLSPYKCCGPTNFSNSPRKGHASNTYARFLLGKQRQELIFNSSLTSTDGIFELILWFYLAWTDCCMWRRVSAIFGDWKGNISLLGKLSICRNTVIFKEPHNSIRVLFEKLLFHWTNILHISSCLKTRRRCYSARLDSMTVIFALWCEVIFRAQESIFFHDICNESKYSSSSS